jgi:modulator of FtsH protease HflC
MSPKQSIGLIILAVVALIASMSTFVVDQREQALVLQFGKPVGVVRDAGLHFKWPWQSVSDFDNRLLFTDTVPNEVITLDKKALLVDNYTRWRIVNPLQVYQVAGTQRGVEARMEDVVRGKMREVLGQNTMTQIVTGGKEANMRNALMEEITAEANTGVKDLGIQVVDVRIKRVDLPKENSDAVFKRMQAERQRIAAQYRSQGEELAREIRAEADKQRKVILADAYEKAQIIRGKADAQTTLIYAKAHKKDPQFYAFMRSLQAYRDSIGKGTRLVVTPDSEFFRFFEHSGLSGSASRKR